MQDVTWFGLSFLSVEVCNPPPEISEPSEPRLDGKILAGHGSPVFMDVGYFYCPYVPVLKHIPLVEDFNPRKGIITRYGRKLLEQGAKHYSRITIGGCETWINWEEVLDWAKESL